VCPVSRSVFRPYPVTCSHLVVSMLGTAGITEVDYAVELLTKTLGLRKTMRDFLHSRVPNVFVPDTVTNMSPEGTPLLEQVRNLEKVFCADGVHLNSDGNRILGNSVKKIIDEYVSAAFCISGRGTTGEYFWRGFLSPVGSSKAKNPSSLPRGRGMGVGG